MSEIKNHPAFRLQAVPEPPDTLSTGARREWATLARLVFDLRTCRPADLRALELLAELLADISAMQAAIRSDGLTTKAGSGGVKAHPALANLAAARKHAEQLLSKFGLVPTGQRVEQYNAGRAKFLYGANE